MDQGLFCNMEGKPHHTPPYYIHKFFSPTDFHHTANLEQTVLFDIPHKVVDAV